MTTSKTITDTRAAWLIAKLAAGDQIEDEDWTALEGFEPWNSLAVAVKQSNGRGRINVLREMCASMPNGAEIEKQILRQDPHKKQKERRVPGIVPPLPKPARLAPDLDEGAAPWLDEYVGYAKAVSPRTPELFHTASGLWLVSLAIARRLVLRMAHKDVYPNIAVLQVAPTTLYAKSTGLGVPRFMASQTMRHLLLPGDMTPEAMIDELAGKQPPSLFDGGQLDMEEWQQGQNFAAQRGVCLDEASSLFVGMTKDYNVGLGEMLLRLYDCDPHSSRQTRGTGRSVVRNAYWTFLGATTPWHLKKADVGSLWHTGLWPRFLLLTPDAQPPRALPNRERSKVPRGLVERLSRLVDEDLPESTLHNPATPIGMGMGDGVFECFQEYFIATSHDLLVAPTAVDVPLFGVYGRLAEQAMKVGMLLAALEWDGNGAPVVQMRHWAWGQNFAEVCRQSMHRLPAMLGDSGEEALEEQVLMWLDSSGDEWNTLRQVGRGLHKPARELKPMAIELEEAGLLESISQGKTVVYRTKRPEDERLVEQLSQG